jgi:hypothetical protein
MKWRQSIIYMIVLLLVGGYFYYFEVVNKERKEAAEKEAKLVFHVQSDNVQALSIQAKDKQPVELKKETEWKIVKPLDTDVDKPSIKSFLNALATLESQREVVASAEDLKPFGLQEPPFKVLFEAGGQSSELQVGDKNPVGGGYYARVADKPRVFLISDGSWTSLNKGLDELRRRELFSLQSDDISGLEVAWQGGETVRLKRDDDGRTWKSPDHPGVKIKDSKVKNVIEQVQWLRAQKFLADDVKDLDPYGLNVPYVTVKLTLKNEHSAELRLAKKVEAKKQVAALSSELSAVVEVPADIMNDLPKEVLAVEDRSLLSLNKEEVSGVKWKVGETRAELVQTAKEKWELKQGDGELKPLKDSWHVSSLLWDLDEAEYQKKADPPPAVPGEPYGRLELWNGAKKLQALIWDKSSEKASDTATLWIETDGASPQPVLVGGDQVKKIETDLNGMIQPEPSKEASK